MEKIWLKSYPEGLPAEINADEYASLLEIFDRSCRAFSTRPAYSNMGRTITFGDLEEMSRCFAAYLQSGLGLQKGERIALMMPNALQYPIALFGALRAGLTIVNVNPLYTARELAHQLNDSGATTILVMANFAKVLAEVRNETPVRHVIITELGDLLGFPKSCLVNFVVKHVKKMVPAYSLPGALTFNQALRRGRGLTIQPVDVVGSDIAFLQYTGGTTGVSKGAVLTHRNLIANMEQISICLKDKIDDGNDIVITALPLYHIFCLVANCLIYMKHGGLNVLITNPRDMPSFVKELSRWPFTVITGVNTLFNGLLNTPGFDALDFSHLQLSVGGGMAVQESIARKWQQTTGTNILEGYGLTECSPVVCVNLPHLQEFSAAIGVPVPSTEVSLRDDQGNEVAFGEPGELCVKGPQVMQGYWQRPEESEKAFVNGWLLTGDIATVDERGYFRIVDRKKDMILVSGFNVFPNEIENVLAMHSAVLECACIGVPDERSGEAVKVFVVLKPNTTATEDEIREHCKANLTGYKLPRLVEFRESLPKSNVGKILRRELR